MTEFPGKFCSEWEWRVFTESVRWHRVTELKEKGKGCNWQHACFLIYKALGLISHPTKGKKEGGRKEEDRKRIENAKTELAKIKF